jgi:DNA polymerase
MPLRHVYDIANAGPDNRFTIFTDQGALIVHNCGFGGALGAFKTMGALYGVDLPESTIMEIVKAYRTTNARIAALWREVESACRRAVENTDTVHRAGKLAVQRTGAWMRMRLPVGRYLCYASPVCDDMGKLSYLGINQYTRKFERLRTYGGKLVENPTQGAARDVLMAWVRRAEDAGYSVVLRVHDELICEVPDTDDFTVEGLLALLPVDEPWLEGLPLAAAGFACYRYGKH